MKGAIFSGILGGVAAAVAGGITLLFGGPVAAVAAGAAGVFGLLGAGLAAVDVGTNGKGESWKLVWLTGLPATAALCMGAHNLGTKLETPEPVRTVVPSSTTTEFNYRCTGTERPTLVATDNGHRVVVPKSCTPA